MPRIKKLTGPPRPDWAAKTSIRLGFGSWAAWFRDELPERLRVRHTAFEVIEKIIEIPSSDCHWSALHGLGHLRYPSLDHPPIAEPDTEVAIRRFVSAHADLGEEIREYADACIKGKII